MTAPDDSPDVTANLHAPRRAWAWWWAYTTSVLVLVAVLAIAVLAGRVWWLVIPGWSVSILGLTAILLGFWQGQGTPTPPWVSATMSRATMSERTAMMRAARRGRTVPGPLADASAWHRDHRFTHGGSLRLPYAPGLPLAMTGNAVGQLAGGVADQPVLFIGWSALGGLMLVMTIVVLRLYWIVLTHAPRTGSANQ